MNLHDFISDYKVKADILSPKNNMSSNLSLIKSNLERLEQISNQLAIESYRFVFIGEPGSGKTTTICNYLNLTKNVKAGDKFSGFELFDTASGRTTAFEVHYIKADRTKFIIYPLDIKKQKDLVREYCEYNWNKVFNIDNIDEEENTPNGREGSSETDRIIRNMIGFSNDQSFQEFLTENYMSDNYEKFYNDILDKISLETRTCTEIDYNHEEDIRKWLKTVFNDINFGKRPDTAIPEQVDVYLNNNDLDYIMPEFISEVIDTRGYDGGAREDLRTYIREDDTLSIILDKVESLPGERQRKILSEWVDSDEDDIINRISLMIKDKDDALSKVNEADDDSELGEQIKREELSHAVRDNKLHYNENNTIFVDSYEGISLKPEYKIVDGQKKKNGKTVIDFDDSLRDYERDRITNHFLNVIENHKSMLSDEALRLQKDTEQLYNAVMASSELEIIQDKLKATEHLITAVKDTLNSEIEDNLFDTEQPFCTHFRNTIHWASARKTASVSWCGTWYKADIFAEYMDFCEGIVKKNSSGKKEQVINYLNNIISEEIVSEEIKSFVASCVTRVELEYRKFTESIRDISKKRFEESFDLEFWEQASVVERGSGYYDRLMECIRKKMRKSNLCINTSSDIQEASDYFFNKIIKVLKDQSDNL